MFFKAVFLSASFDKESASVGLFDENRQDLLLLLL
jgi:hypothetical protein